MGRETELAGELKRFFAQEAEDLGITLVYLFGSRAQGAAGPQSDCDVAILFLKEPPASGRYALEHRLGGLLGAGRVDLVVLNRAPVELQYNVIATGRLVYETDRASRVEFEARTLGLYGDFLPVLRRQRRELLEEGDYETGIQRYRAALGAAVDVLAEARAS